MRCAYIGRTVKLKATMILEVRARAGLRPFFHLVQLIFLISAHVNLDIL